MFISHHINGSTVTSFCCHVRVPSTWHRQWHPDYCAWHELTIVCAKSCVFVCTHCNNCMLAFLLKLSFRKLFWVGSNQILPNNVWRNQYRRYVATIVRRRWFDHSRLFQMSSTSCDKFDCPKQWNAPYPTCRAHLFVSCINTISEIIGNYS